MNKKIKKLLPLFDGALITTAVLLGVFALKHIWPFGTANVTYDDMAQGTLPFFYHIYDWLHGDSALLFDWFSGLGVNVTSSGTVTPLDFIIFFFKRDNLIYSMGILLIIRSAIAAFTARLSFEKMFPDAADMWKTLLSVSYALSAFAMFYYTNLFWLDFVIVFPLVLLGGKRLLDDNKPALYTITYAVALILSFYQGFMITLTVFFIGGLYILLILDKSVRAQRTFLLGLSTVSGALLSAWRLVPMAAQTLASKRFGTNLEETHGQNLLEKVLNTTNFVALPLKAVLLVGLELAFALAAVLLIRLLKRKEFKKSLFVFGGLFFMFSQVVFENISLFWHGGSYVQFPLRFFFTSVFVLFSIVLAGMSKFGETAVPEKKKVLRVLAIIFAVVLAAGFLVSTAFFATRYGDRLSIETGASKLKFILFILMYATGFPLFLILLRRKKKYMRALCLILTVIECFAVAYAGVGNTYRKSDNEQLYASDSYTEYCKEAAQLDLDCSEFGRIKNPDTSLNTNYPFLLKTQSLSNWTHNIPASLQRASSVLGCGTQYTRLLDNGGTALTDAMFNVKKAVFRNERNVSAQYSLIEATENFSVYKNEYAVDFGLLSDSRLLTDITTTGTIERFEIQNYLFSLFDGSSDKLFSVCGTDGDYADNIEIVDQTDKKIGFVYTATGNEELYLNAVGFSSKETMKILVNGERVYAPYYKHTTYAYYPSSAVNGVLDLGTFSRGDVVQVTAEVINDRTLFGKAVQLGSMSLDRVKDLGTLYADTVSNEKVSKSGLSFDYNNPTGEEKYLFVPVGYDDGWSCKINGENADVYKALGAYIAVKLPSGSGTVQLEFSLDKQPLGIGLSLVGVLSALLLFFMKKRDYSVPKWLRLAAFWVFVALFTAGVILVYGTSIAYFFTNIIIVINAGQPTLMNYLFGGLI